MDYFRNRMEVFLELVDLHHWKTFKEINKELIKLDIKTDSSTWQKMVNAYNDQFYLRKEKTFIAHSQKGYMLTANKDVIKESLNDYRSRAMAQLKHYYRGMSSIGASLNLNFDEELKQNG